MIVDPPHLERITPELLARHDRPGPRYTSYPRAADFSESFTATDYQRRLTTANQRADEPLSLYVHIPFCERRCSFCGCNTIISQRGERARAYLEYVFREVDLLAEQLPDRRRLVQYHWGGGTPTFLTLGQIEMLQRKVTEHFVIDDNAEVAIEVDPEVTTPRATRPLPPGRLQPAEHEGTGLHS